MSHISNQILEEQEFSRKEIEAMPEPDGDEEQQREKDEVGEPQCFEQQENNRVNEL